MIETELESLRGSFKIEDRKVVIRIRDRICESSEQLLESKLCFEVVRRCLKGLARKNSPIFKILGQKPPTDDNIKLLINTLLYLQKLQVKDVLKVADGSDEFLSDKNLLRDFVEYLYNYWRHFDRFIICDSEGDVLDKRPFRTFNSTIEDLTLLVRKTYRDIQENVTGTHPRIYRQVIAGAEMSAIALPKEIPYPATIYKELNVVPVIRQILFYPPLVLNPSMNKRKGKFERIGENPLKWFQPNKDEWLCYPTKVGSLIIYVYFHEKFYELGLSLGNLFELADDEDLKRKPDAVYLFGVPEEAFEAGDVFPTVFYDDEANSILIGAVPGLNEFGYFGYLKKMILTLHNIVKMKSGSMPFHGALVQIILKRGKSATLLLIGDTGAGKSETLEALRELGEETIGDLVIIADDMGSLELAEDGQVMGYGTEIGAFLRLDDLQKGYAFGQMDRAIIMNPSQINARIVMPVTSFSNVIKGHTVDYVLYANNYEQVDEDHPIIERFDTPDDAINVFREGTVMSKGTTTSTGLVHSYFANVFGPVQYRELHEALARQFFNTFFEAGVFVGLMRTRLGIAGFERRGPEASARELLKIIGQAH
jgi:energy-coupling factor transporter ATP-binding protein EcfA2